MKQYYLPQTMKPYLTYREVISKDQPDFYHKVRAKVIDSTPDRYLQVCSKIPCDRDATSIKQNQFQCL